MEAAQDASDDASAAVAGAEQAVADAQAAQAGAPDRAIDGPAEFNVSVQGCTAGECSTDTTTVTVTDTVVDDPTPQENVAASLAALSAFAGESKQAEKAYDKLAEVTNSDAWVDGYHLDMNDGDKLLRDIEQAINALQAAAKKKGASAGLQAAANNAIITLSDVCQTVALTALAEAQQITGLTTKE